MMKRAGVMVRVLLALASVGSWVQADPFEEIDDSDDATDHRGENGRQFVYQCSEDVGESEVWGSGPYSDDSSICSAAVHAGRISAARGGRVRIEIVGGRSSYRGSSRHGVESLDYGSWPGSFTFR